MSELEIVLVIYRNLLGKIENGVIPVNMRSKSIIGTVQDDPFDNWIYSEIETSLPSNFEIFHSGSLTTPDLVIRNTETGTMIGLEIKKLIQKSNGSDSRGLTIDYNSCLPCGSTFVKVGTETVIIPCFYLFALLDINSQNIVTLIVLDGDFLNYDFELHKESKYSNYTEYNHGPYNEGSIRHRKMYTYPNPLNSKITQFHLNHILVAKKADLQKLREDINITAQIVRKDKYDNSFYYLIKDESPTSQAQINFKLDTIQGIFDACKERLPKERTASIPNLSPLK
jgi:hypothetical protein